MLLTIRICDHRKALLSDRAMIAQRTSRVESTEQSAIRACNTGSVRTLLPVSSEGPACAILRTENMLRRPLATKGGQNSFVVAFQDVSKFGLHVAVEGQVDDFDAPNRLASGSFFMSRRTSPIGRTKIDTRPRPKHCWQRLGIPIIL